MKQGPKRVAVEVENVQVGLKLGPNMDSQPSIRRSSRKKEDKSYVEIPDSMIEINESRGHNNGPLSCKDRGFSQNSISGGAAALSNGDVEMESEDEVRPDHCLYQTERTKSARPMMQRQRSVDVRFDIDRPSTCK